MRNAFNKDIFREIMNTIDRFLGIFIIIALGVSFFAGIGSTGTRMKVVQDAYLDEQNLMDIRLVSNYGFNENDIIAISQVEGIQQVYPAYSIDALVHGPETTLNLKVHSIYIGDDFNKSVNKPYLLSGRLPEKAGETVVEKGLIDSLGVSIGDTITLESGKKADIRNNLRTKRFKIVGIVKSPYYISNERGTGSIGNGKIDCYIMIPQDDFYSPVYSEVFLIIDGAKDVLCFNDEYMDIVDKTITRLESLEPVRARERAAEMTRKAYENINEQLQNLANKRSEVSVQLDESYAGLQMFQTQITDLTAQLAINRKQANQDYLSVTLIKDKLNMGLNEIEAGLNTINDARNDLYSNLAELERSKSLIYDEEASLLRNEDMIISQYPSGSEILRAALVEIEAGKASLFASKTKLYEMQREIEDGFAALDYSESELEQQRESIKQSLSSIDTTIKEIEIGQRSLDLFEKQITDNRLLLSKNIAEYEQAVVDSSQELDDAENALRLAKEQLNDINEPEWYILDRESNAGFLSYREDADKIQAIGRIFPLFFFLVAALICLTTMTRLVEERRIELGTLKALGYSNNRILSKYLIYATVPTLLGGFTGGYIGMQIFPNIIINAYHSLYTIPQSSAYFDYPLWGIGILLSVITTLTATIQTCKSELRENPAMLLRPKAPKTGKRTILESFSFLWKKLSFSRKVTMRNIIRYKKRFFMTVTGIGGCTALLLAGFGIKDSISGLINKQFESITIYDVKVSFADKAKKSDITNVINMLNTDSFVRGNIISKEKLIDAAKGNGRTERVTLIVPEDAENLKRFISLQERTSQNELLIKNDGVIISEKLSTLLDLKIGDEITLKDGDSITVIANISGICENYFNNYVYMHSESYASLFNSDVEYNSIYMLLDKNTPDDVSATLANRILDKHNVNSVAFMSTTRSNAGGVIDSLNIVVLVIVISAGVLAFVVLYNLTNININERIRELATIEVLGFKDREVEDYVYRENMILTAVGILFGFLLGYFLHLYIIHSVESRLMMFSREIFPLSYLYSMMITTLFATSVNKLTSRKLKKINMVEALKSIE